MVAPANNGAITFAHRVPFICMIIVAFRRQALASSHLHAPSILGLGGGATFVNGIRHHRHQHQHNHCARHISLFATNPPCCCGAASLKRDIAPFYHHLRQNKSMTPLSMSVEEAPSSTSTTSPLDSPTTTNNSSNTKAMTAKLVPATLTSLKSCGERLRSGHLVSFPTETVYGLGCHALDPTAVQRVFDAKERPLSDPLIVHVTRGEDALELWAASCSAGNNESSENTSNDGMQQQSELQQREREIEKQALTVLTQAFFPGPLTLVARARPTIPRILMANTGYVACRSPSHTIARKLIDAAQCPIAAPSANKFGHVSPTLAKHVLDDLGREDVWIVDPSLGVDVENNAGENVDGVESGMVCQVGVESTVAKIEINTENDTQEITGSITILRHGAISSQSIREALVKANLGQYFSVSDSVKFTSEKVHNVAPGQTVKHYSPNVPCFMVSSSRQLQQSKIGDGEMVEEEQTVLSQSVIIDYGQRLSHYQQKALAYRDLSPEGNASIAASSVFETLRWSETIEGAIRVFVPEIVLESNNAEQQEEEGAALVLAVKDKLTRAASAVVVKAFR